MTATADVLAAIDRGFARTPHPGAAFLQGSREGCEPGEAIAPLLTVDDWRAVPADVLDQQAEALSFLSEGGFRYFLPAWLRADVRGELRRADPVFHLTMGFTSTVVEVPAGGRTFARGGGGRTLLNPRRYGAMTFEDSARQRLSVFCREEAAAILLYLAFRRGLADLDQERDAIDAAVDRFWRDRAASAPTADELEAHVAAELAFLDALRGISRNRET